MLTNGLNVMYILQTALCVCVTICSKFILRENSPKTKRIPGGVVDKQENVK